MPAKALKGGSIPRKTLEQVQVCPAPRAGQADWSFKPVEVNMLVIAPVAYLRLWCLLGVGMPVPTAYCTIRVLAMTGARRWAVGFRPYLSVRHLARQTSPLQRGNGSLKSCVTNLISSTRCQISLAEDHCGLPKKHGVPIVVITCVPVRA
jgi:hypothetical protein